MSVEEQSQSANSQQSSGNSSQSTQDKPQSYGTVASQRGANLSTGK